MDEFQAALLIGAVVTALISYRTPHALLWIGCGAASFVASTIWQKEGLPNREAFGVVTDFAIVVALYVFAEKRWEMRVWNCFHLMIVLDVLYMSKLISSHYFLIVGLELANWLALLIIASAGLVERAENGDRSASWYGIGALYRSLYSERSDHPFKRK